MKELDHEGHGASELSGYPPNLLYLNPRYTLEKIVAQIPENCMKAPRFKK